MEKLEHFTIDDIWSDFTKSTQMDEAISIAELKINDLLKGRGEGGGKERFGLQGKYYELFFVPESTKKQCAQQSSFYDDKSIEDIIITLFGVRSAFFYVTSKGGIDSKEARTVISILSSAATGCKITFPFFVGIQKKEYMTFLGFSYDGNNYTHMSSFTDWRIDTQFTGFGKLRSLFFDNLGKEVTLETNQRKFYEVDKEDFGRCTFRESTFYSKVKQDPIQSIKFIVQSNPTTDKKEKMSIDELDNVAVIVEFGKRNVQETRLSRFVNFFYQTQQLSTFSRSSYDSWSQQKIENLWERASKPGYTSVLKAAPKDSILCDLVASMTAAENLLNACSMWTMFIKKVRNAFDRGETIPGVETTGPNFDNCLIYQKLQMINYCITQKDAKKREFTESKDTGKLLLNGKPMISPSTQTVSAKTEDQVYESEELLLKNYDDQVQKSKLQSQQLEADISAFKAENEGCCFEDFVRWYSPADFNEEKKSLSSRMSEEGNVWRMMYDKNPPIKAIDQEPVFNSMQEAELALDYLESMIPGEVFGDLIYVILAVAYFNINSTTEKRVFSNTKYIAEVERALNEFHKEIDLAPSRIAFNDYIDISIEKVHIIEQAASDISVVNSLLKKFPGCFDFIQSLIDNNIALVSNPTEKEAVKELIKTLQIPDKKYRKRSEYVLSGQSEEMKQRMYVVRFFDKLGLPNHAVVATTIQETAHNN